MLEHIDWTTLIAPLVGGAVVSTGVWLVPYYVKGEARQQAIIVANEERVEHRASIDKDIAHLNSNVLEIKTDVRMILDHLIPPPVAKQ